MYAASQITSTAIVPFPKFSPPNVKKGGTQPYVLLFTDDDGITTTCCATPGSSKFVGVTISETDWTTPNKALTVQLSGLSVVRVESNTHDYGTIMYGGDNGEATRDSTKGPVIGRYLRSIGKHEGFEFATILLARSALKRVNPGSPLKGVLAYECPYRKDKTGDVISATVQHPQMYKSWHDLSSPSTAGELTYILSTSTF